MRVLKAKGRTMSLLVVFLVLLLIGQSIAVFIGLRSSG